jgi:hypothetical protein
MGQHAFGVRKNTRGHLTRGSDAMNKGMSLFRTVVGNMDRRRLALRTAFPAIVAVVALLIAWVTPAMALGTWEEPADVPSVGPGVEGMSVGVTDLGSSDR